MKPLFHIKPPSRHRRSRRWLLVPLLLLVGLGFGIRALNATETLPPFEGTLEPFPVVEPVAGVEACWIETGAFPLMDATASSLVIRHPQGILLVDAGTSLKIDAEMEPYRGLQKFFMRVGPGSLRAEVPVTAHLEALGVEPSELTAVIVSHAHIDHVGGLRELPASVPVWAPAEELTFARREGGASAPSFHVVREHAKLLTERGQALELVETETGPFERVADVFGDGTVQVVSTFGHTPGSIGIYVVLPDGRRLFFAGDTINRVRELSPPQSKTRAMAVADVDPERAHAVVRRLARLKELDPTLEWLPGHERSAWSRAFGTPGTCIGAGDTAASR
ncbi:MAG TPA: MBL fold metallo-hydrolase [Myxococcaceae bacterium]|nr:MBL fold metallo-hydrolase [Myxococcaceae bacterium]